MTIRRPNHGMRYHSQREAGWSQPPGFAILEVASTEKEPHDLRRYFAKPGEAEWGC